MKIKCCIALTLFALNTYGGSLIKPYVPCSNNPQKMHARSVELRDLVKADQKERDELDLSNNVDGDQLNKNDLIRRKRVGQIFAEGCMHTSEDYAAAALIYQHGDTSDHYYQAYIWANRSAEEGDLRQKQLAALAIDRYLISKGMKQLFGSQAFMSAATERCFCMQEVEETFPDSFRQ